MAQSTEGTLENHRANPGDWAVSSEGEGRERPAHLIIPTGKGSEPILASYEITAGNTLTRPTYSDEAESIEQRLRQLGAIHYVLEPWGSQGNYRFSCRIAIGGNPEYTRYFEATGRDGLSAMSKVLGQVEGCNRQP